MKNLSETLTIGKRLRKRMGGIPENDHCLYYTGSYWSFLYCSRATETNPTHLWIYRHTSGSLPCPETKWFHPNGSNFYFVKITLAP